MKKVLVLILLLLPLTGYSQTDELSNYSPPVETFYRAEILEIVEDVVDSDSEILGYEQYRQVVRVRILNGDEQGNEFELDFIPGSTGTASNKLAVGDTALVVRAVSDIDTRYFIFDHNRFPTLLIVGLLFILLILIVTRFKGIRSLIGLAVTIGILILFILPSLVKGGNPLTIAMVAAIIIAVLTLYTTHGLKKTTSIAVVSTLVTVFIATGAGWLTVLYGKLYGLGTESAFYLQLSGTGEINLQGLLLAGIIIGALGILDDITVTQVAVVEELHKTNSKLSQSELFKKGLAVGHSHIASLINTLVLAYAGASLPLLLHFTQLSQPVWVTLNSELVAEEIVRTIIGSAALVLAVPITTAIAAYVIGKQSTSSEKES